MIRSARLTAFALLAIGAGLLLLSAYVSVVSLLAMDWPKTEGIIFTASATRTFGNLEKGSGFFGIDVKYRYTIRGLPFEGDHLHAVDLALIDQGTALGFVDDHPSGRLIDVYYDADDPGSALLLTGIPPSVFNLFLPSLIFQAVGASMLMRATARAM